MKENSRNTNLNFTADYQIYVLYRTMTSILFCRTCSDNLKCDGYIDCPWLSPHDEANCSQQCPLLEREMIPCDCNKPGNMTCEGKIEGINYVCYDTYGKFFVLNRVRLLGSQSVITLSNPNTQVD